MGWFIDLTGKQFGILTVVERSGTANDKQALWKCRCDCGNFHIARGRDLRDGRVKSCGCKSKEWQGKARLKHGMTNTRIYRIWAGMNSRCSNKNIERYIDYGGRGITVCDEWKGENGFQNFYDWAMSNGYREGLTIDRIDNSKGYSLDNCRWATAKEQANNRRTNRIIEFNGESHTSCEWAEIIGIDRNVIENRIDNLGWSIEKALTTKVRGKSPIIDQKLDRQLERIKAEEVMN